MSPRQLDPIPVADLTLHLRGGPVGHHAGGRLWVTTAPAPTTVSSPMLTPGTRSPRPRAAAVELRPEALRTARTIAYVTRVAWEGTLYSGLLDEPVPEHLSPFAAIRVLARLGYALIALAEDDPEADTLLSRLSLTV